MDKTDWKALFVSSAFVYFHDHLCICFFLKININTHIPTDNNAMEN